MKRKMLTDEQARAYIQGEEPFDAEQYERDHVEMLCRSVAQAINNYNDGKMECPPAEAKCNLIRTVSNYVRCHPTSDKLVDLLNEIKNL